VRLWEVETGKCRRFWNSGVGHVSSLAWAPDGKRLAASASSNSILHIVEIATGKSLGQMHNSSHNVRSASYHPDGKILATAGSEGVVRLWDVEALKEKPFPPGHLREVTALAFNADRTSLLSGSPDGTARLWDLKTGKERLRLQWPEHYWISSVAFSPDGTVLAVGGHNETQLFNGKTGKCLRRLTGQEGVAWHAAFSPEGKTFVTGSNGGTICWWDVESGKKLREEPYEYPSAWGLQFRRDGTLLVDGWKTNGVFRYQWEGKKEVLRAPNWTVSLQRVPALSADGRFLASTEKDGAIDLWETGTQQIRLRFVSDQQEELRCLAVSPDGRRLATGSADSTILVWDTMGTMDAAIQRLREDLDTCWLRLGGQGAGEAYRAIRALASVPEKAAPFLDRCLQGNVEKTRAILKLVGELESPRFAVREKATKDLLDLGPVVRPHLEAVLEAKPSLDTERRIKGILEKLPRQGLPPLVRDLRAIEALELMATPEARAVLKRLAGGPADSTLAREAKAALGRLRE
jgi:WD40 repeat protein